MKSINKICTVLLLLVLFSYNLPAQTVETVGGYPVINLEELRPLGAVLTFSEADARRKEMNAQKPSNSDLLQVGLDVSGPTGTWNDKMSPKFQVMQNNVSPQQDWTNTWIACSQYSGEGGQAGEWRLPTVGELQMIWALHPQLKKINGFTPFTAKSTYSATEKKASQEWRVNFSNGNTSTPNLKKTAAPARCVRDLE